jgi:hypothetical protein
MGSPRAGAFLGPAGCRATACRRWRPQGSGLRGLADRLCARRKRGANEPAHSAVVAAAPAAHPSGRPRGHRGAHVVDVALTFGHPESASRRAVTFASSAIAPVGQAIGGLPGRRRRRISLLKRGHGLGLSRLRGRRRRRSVGRMGPGRPTTATPPPPEPSTPPDHTQRARRPRRRTRRNGRAPRGRFTSWAPSSRGQPATPDEPLGPSASMASIEMSWMYEAPPGVVGAAADGARASRRSGCPAGRSCSG